MYIQPNHILLIRKPSTTQHYAQQSHYAYQWPSHRSFPKLYLSEPNVIASNATVLPYFLKDRFALSPAAGHKDMTPPDALFIATSLMTGFLGPPVCYQIDTDTKPFPNRSSFGPWYIFNAYKFVMNTQWDCLFSAFLFKLVGLLQWRHSPRCPAFSFNIFIHHPLQ